MHLKHNQGILQKAHDQAAEVTPNTLGSPLVDSLESLHYLHRGPLVSLSFLLVFLFLLLAIYFCMRLLQKFYHISLHDCVRACTDYPHLCTCYKDCIVDMHL